MGLPVIEQRFKEQVALATSVWPRLEASREPGQRAGRPPGASCRRRRRRLLLRFPLCLPCRRAHGRARPAPLPPLPQIMEEVEVLWEVPAEPKGVLFVAHGCSHSGR